ncbi:MAG: hypothetical protein ACRDMI_05820 [Streptosporangiaceae bacterium]
MVPVTTTSSLYEGCRALFSDYPLASWADACGARSVRSMVVMLQGGDHPQFFVLTHRRGDGPDYTMSPWPVGSMTEITADGDGEIPDRVRTAVRHGVPIPRDGSLFGWSDAHVITALVAVETVYTPASPWPTWAVMPRAGFPEAEWPPFTREPIFGHWFWEHYRDGNVVSLSDAIAATPDTVFWVDTTAILGSDCCAVGRDIDVSRGHTLLRGCYAYYRAWQAGQAAPPLSALLADASKIDLAPRFQRWGNGDETSPGEP